MSVEMIEGIWEMRNGGITGEIIHDPSNYETQPWTDGVLTWDNGGTHEYDHDEEPSDLIRYIAPAASVDNGDGTTTKTVTIPVTMRNEAWETHDVAKAGFAEDGDNVFDVGGTIYTAKGIHRYPRLILTPKTPPVDPYWPLLADAIDRGECEIPSRAKWLAMTYSQPRYFDEEPTKSDGSHGWVTPRLAKGEADANGLLGVVPSINEGSFPIDLAAFRKWHAERGEV